MRLSLRFAIPLVLALGPMGCVSSNSVRAKAEALIAEKTGIKRSRPNDEGTAKLRTAILSLPLTPESSAQLAVLNHPDVDAGFAELGIARGELLRALSFPNPEVSASLLFIDGHAEPEYQLGASIDVTRFLLLAAKHSAAARLLDAASVEAAGVAMDVALEARRAFYGYTAARQVLELRRTAAFALAQSADAAQRIFDAGNSAALDAVAERALFEEARLGVARAEVDELAARERLSLALGLFGPEAAQQKVSERLPELPAREIPLAEVERRALEQSLDLRAWRSRYAAAAGRADLATWAWLPTIRGGVVAEREVAAGWGVGPQLGLEVPLFYQGQGEAAAAEGLMQVARARIRSVGAAVRTSARTLSARLRSAREQALFHRQTLLPLRQRVVDETQLQFNAMNTGIFQLLSAKRDQIDAGRAYVDTLRDYWIVRAEMEQLLAGRLVSATGGSGASPDTMFETDVRGDR